LESFVFLDLASGRWWIGGLAFLASLLYTIFCAAHTLVLALLRGPSPRYQGIIVGIAPSHHIATAIRHRNRNRNHNHTRARTAPHHARTVPYRTVPHHIALLFC
jgi:hypothetical protein